MTPRVQLLFIGLVAAAIGGCVPPGGDTGGEVTPVATAPETAVAGETVELVGGVTEAAAGLTYRWIQVSGRMVQLINADQPVARFVAPSMGKEQRLTFRLDVRDAAGRLWSTEVAVTVAADPESTEIGGGSGDDGEDNEPFPRVRLVTSKGDIVVELNRTRAPVTVANFLKYLDDAHYNQTIFHRVIKDFVVQGGGYNAKLDELPTRAPIKNEADNGLANDRGTIAMARTNDPNSATSQFYINVKNNNDLNKSQGNAGYAVFGVVISGMDVVDEISKVETETRSGFADIPKEDIVLVRAERLVTNSGGGGGSSSGGLR